MFIQCGYFYLRNACKVPAMAARLSALNGSLGSIFSADFAVISVRSSSIRFMIRSRIGSNSSCGGRGECTFFWPLVGGLFWKKGTKQAAVCSRVGAIATYIFATYFIKIAGINAVVWGLMVGAVLYFGIGFVTGRKGLDPDILDKCF